MSTPRALVIRTAGTNCDAELCRAFELGGASVELLHIDTLCADPDRIAPFDLIGFPGGFSYGDDISSGRILAMHVRQRLFPAMHEASKRGAAMIGICNGFQVMVQAGLLPSPITHTESPPAARVALGENADGRFRDDWVRIEPNPESVCIWTQSLAQISNPDLLTLPIANGEGRFVVHDQHILDELTVNHQIALRYSDDINGSVDRIAGICDPTGRIFGLMPHPERAVDWTRYPSWTRLSDSIRSNPTPWFTMFADAIHAVKGIRA
ncbi:MAG: phosphoribosylformylglycinamidine synthase subunit PurQ [Phycisphaerales bacterium]|nr:phosphoribosylformylglycinamidine synthase subunit PurQ [Phycisphaerales bacterium]